MQKKLSGNRFYFGPNNNERSMRNTVDPARLRLAHKVFKSKKGSGHRYF